MAKKKKQTEAPTEDEVRFWAHRVGRMVVVAFAASVLILVLGQAVLVLLGLRGSGAGRNATVFAALLPLFSVLGMLLLYLSAFTKDCLDLNRDGRVDMDDVRLIPYYTRGRPEPSVNGVHPRDMRAFVRSICSGTPHTQAQWRGRQMPSGKTCDNDYYAQMADTLAEAGFIVGRGPRVAGDLAERDADVIIEHLGL